jgi:hypothetical protein
MTPVSLVEVRMSIRNIKFIISSILVTLIVAGCAPIQSSKVSENTYGLKKMVGIGDLVYSAEKRKSLPNVFGNADLFGRTTTAGRTTVVYAGVRSGTAYFQRKTVDIDSGETTMNSSGPIILPNTQTTYHSGNVGGHLYSGRSTTVGAPTVINPSKPEAKYMDRGTLFIQIDIAKLPQSFVVEGERVTVLKADANSAEVILSK